MCDISKEKNAVLIRPVIYKAEVKTDTSTKIYIVSTGVTFKSRYKNQKHTLDNRNANSTALSSYVWVQRDVGKHCDITWKIKPKTGAYTAGAIYCDVCLTEKTYIHNTLGWCVPF